MSVPNGPKGGGSSRKRRSGSWRLRTDDRASFGASFGLLFSVVVVLSAITASVSIPDEAVSDARPQAQVETVGAGMGSEFDETTRELIAQKETSKTEDRDDDYRGKDGRFSAMWIDHRSGTSRGQQLSAGNGMTIPSHAWNRIPEAKRERIRDRLGTFVQHVQHQQSRDGEVTRVEAAGDGIVPGAHLKQHGGQHTVQVEIVEPYTEEIEVIDHHKRVLVGTDRRWKPTSPGRGWHKTSDTRAYAVDSRFQTSATRPGAGWLRLERVGREQILSGTDHRYHWSESRAAPGIYVRLPGYTYEGIVDSERVQVGTTPVHHWSGSMSDRSLPLLLQGYRYSGIVDSRQFVTGTESMWVWRNQLPPGTQWRKVGQKRVKRGYTTKVSPSHPEGKNWELTGIDHVETKEVVSYKDKWIVGWYTYDQWIDHIHYKTEKKWVPGRTEWVEKKRWVRGRYKTVTKRKWVGWKTKRSKKWVSGRWRKSTSRKKVTSKKRVCRWRWSWWRGPYKSCRTKTVTKWKKVTRKKWVSGHWKRSTKRVWVGWKTVRKKRWVNGHYETRNVRKEIPGYWKKEKVKVGVHIHRVPRTIWGPHKERVKVTSEKTILHYGWRKPIYAYKFKYERPTFETSYQHRYEKPRFETRFKHHFTRPQYDWQPVYRWQKDVTGTMHLWERPVYRSEPVYRTEVVRKERTKTVEHDAETAPFVYDEAGDWTLATGVTRVRDSSLHVERALLIQNESDPLQLIATSHVDGTRWVLSVWREGDAIVLRTNRGVEDRVRTRTATIEFDAGTINGEDLGIELARGVSTPYTLSFRNGDHARGTFDFTIVGRPAIAGQEANHKADEPTITVTDGIVYSATFDITLETDSTTYTDRITVEPSTGERTEDEA